jgi:hypothetical protein
MTNHPALTTIDLTYRDWAVPFPLDPCTAPTVDPIHLQVPGELVQRLDPEELCTYLHLTLWHERGEESTLRRLTDDCWYRDLWRAEALVTSLANKGLIRDSGIYLTSLERHYALFTQHGGDPSLAPRPGRYEPDSDGTWSGPWPMVFETNYPPHLKPVVYFLYESPKDPVYIGSTDDFRGRLISHQRTKRWIRWRALPCDTRDAAYELEDELIAEYRPVLNRRMARTKTSAGGAA